MNLTKIEKLFVYISASITLAQSITWQCLCLIGIIVGLTSSNYANVTYMTYIKTVLKGIFLFDGSNDQWFEGQTVLPILFLIIELFFYFINLRWALSSGLVIYKLRNNKPDFTKQFLVFGYYSIFICTMDFILAMVLFADYTKCVKNAGLIGIDEERLVVEAICANSFLLLGIIVFKGVVLWIINALIAAFAIYISKYLSPKAIGAVEDGNQPNWANVTPNQQNFEPPVNNNGYSSSPNGMQNVNQGNYYNPNVPKPHGFYPDQKNEQQFPNYNRFNRNTGNLEDYNNQNMNPSYLRRGYDDASQRQNNMPNQGQNNSNYPSRDFSRAQDLKNMQDFAIERPKLMNPKPYNPRNDSRYN